MFNENISPTEVNLQHETRETKESYLESARKVGQAYRDLIESLVYKKPFASEVYETLPEELQEQLKQMSEVVKIYQEKYQQIMEEKKWGAIDLLAQAVPEEQKDLLKENQDKLSLEELSTGLYAIHIDQKFYQQLLKSDKLGYAQAQAVKVKNGISFIILPKDARSEELRQKFLEENIPHEANHLVWFFMQQEGKVTTIEENEDIKKGFLLYREELLCRLCSDGNLGGYDHVRGSSAKRKELEERDPATLQFLDTTNDRIIDLCQDLVSSIVDRRSKLKKADLIKAVMESQSYDQLLSNLATAKEYFNQMPVDEEDEDTTRKVRGW